MTETKIRETNISGDGDDGIVHVVIADNDTFEEANLHIAVLVQSNVDGPFLAHIQRRALQIAQEAIDEGVAGACDAGTINDAVQSLSEGDSLRADNSFKDAAGKYKDSVSKAISC